MGGINPKILLSQISGISPRFLKYLSKLKLTTVRDLVWHFPVRYEDFSKIYKIAELEPGQQATIQGVIEKTDWRRSRWRRLTIFEILVSDETGSIRAVWFNQFYLRNSLRPGQTINLSGKVNIDDNELYLTQPAYELISKRWQETRNTGRLVPIYPETKGLTSRGLRYLLQPILNHLEKLSETIPKEILNEYRLPEINRALKQIHFPGNINEALLAKQRFSFEEIFLLQLFNLRQKLKLAKEKAPVLKIELENLKKIIAELPFELTLSQKKSLWEIVQDIEKPKPMNRLLQGDVGSGKTVIAAITALIAAQNKCQAVFLAPTEVLAYQHFKTLKNLFDKIISAANFKQLPIGLLTAGAARIYYENGLETDLKQRELHQKIEAGEVFIIIGTHALIQKTVHFKNLGLVIVDEQHRFGVEQRAHLSRNANYAKARELREPESHYSHRPLPHFLSMSATPIPRTLSLTIFGDLDLSTITELPKGRQPIITKIVSPTDREKTYRFIKEQIKAGRQAFVICPRIEPYPQNNADSARNYAEILRQSASNPRLSALGETKAVKEEYEKLSKKIFPDLKIAMLHGRLKSKEKGAIMKEFQENNINILVSTSVIEVGVDIPNAAIMMIEDSERFGLAQLYQFRGRVGRGQHQSYCFLFTDSNAQPTQRRLKAIIEAKNGFELAEKDLAIRGPGEFLGERQTGLPDFVMNALQDPELAKNSRRAAIKILTADSTLKKYPLLKSRLQNFQQEIHFE